MLAYPLPVWLSMPFQDLRRPSALPACKNPHCNALRARKAALQIGDLRRCRYPRWFRRTRRGLHRRASGRKRTISPFTRTVQASARPHARNRHGVPVSCRCLARVCEIEPWQDMRVDVLAVDVKRDWHRSRHAGPPALRSGRPEARRRNGPATPSQDAGHGSRGLLIALGIELSASAVDASDNMAGVMGDVDEFLRALADPVDRRRQRTPDQDRRTHRVQTIACAARPTMA